MSIASGHAHDRAIKQNEVSVSGRDRPINRTSLSRWANRNETVTWLGRQTNRNEAGRGLSRWAMYLEQGRFVWSSMDNALHFYTLAYSQVVSSSPARCTGFCCCISVTLWNWALNCDMETEIENFPNSIQKCSKSKSIFPSRFACYLCLTVENKKHLLILMLHTLSNLMAY